jgi:Fe-S-cluster-containing hydrogenase component 2
LPDKEAPGETARIDSIEVSCKWMCGVCGAVCPEDAIACEAGTVRVDPEVCSRCLTCVRLCPAGILEDGTFEGL